MAQNADGAEKSEAPTPSKRNKAAEQGQLPRSQDLTAAGMLLGFFIMLNWFGGNIVNSVREIMRSTLEADLLVDLPAERAFEWLGQLAITMLTAMMPLMLGAVVVAILMNTVQVGVRLTPAKLQPKLSTLSPMKGLKKIFGFGQGPMQLVMNLGKMVLVGGVAYTAIHGRIDDVLFASQLAFAQIFGLTTGLVFDIGIRVAVALFVLALIDWGYQKWKNEQELKMTKQEVKEEMKRMDGDPHIKQRRRQVQMQQAMGQVRSEVPKADVIVTNPTHYAVAIKYDENNMHAPKVVAKGGDYMAFRIREIAIANNIPIVERPPLARALYANVEVGQFIPEEMYNAVAEILAYVFEMSGKREAIGSGR